MAKIQPTPLEHSKEKTQLVQIPTIWSILCMKVTFIILTKRQELKLLNRYRLIEQIALTDLIIMLFQENTLCFGFHTLSGNFQS